MEQHGRDIHVLKALVEMTPEQRVDVFSTNLPRLVQPLHLLEPPLLCNAYPEFKEEIKTAYLKVTKFTVPVRVNYDAACKRFFFDGRMATCGQLTLSPHIMARLEDALGTQQLSRVRLEVNTPFETLAHINLGLRDHPDGRTKVVRASVKMSLSDAHPDMADFLLDVCDRLKKSYFPAENREGFDLEDIKEVATWLQRWPTDRELADKKRVFYKESPWMDLTSDEDNLGWTDFVELDKVCDGKCEGCRGGTRYGGIALFKKFHMSS